MLRRLDAPRAGGPGFTATDFRFRALDGDGTVAKHPQSSVGRILTPDDVAWAVVAAAAERNLKLLVLSTTGRIARWLSALFPALYERVMVRSLRSELQR